MSEPRFAVGIDLGTTHCALSFVDLAAGEGEHAAEAVLPVPQLTAPGTVEARPLLPSFLYLPHPEEIPAGDLVLPWAGERTFVVGELARDRGAQTPIRLVASAKSWLCHPAVDRRGPVLPVDAPPDLPRLSPLEVSVCYLEHLREAWNHARPEAPLEAQAVTVTIPASFDPAARELTAEAARLAGLEHFALLEEPQAALYSWIQRSQGAWRRHVRVGDVILVVDLGGGTTDLSLMYVGEQEGDLDLRRIAVGDHILLGGDNMDLALAHGVASKLAAQGNRLEPWQLRGLTHGCRQAKELLLSDGSADAAPIVVPSRGSRLVGGSLRTELTREEVATTILEGFFPRVDVGARPVSRTRAGLTQVGLPYAQDAAVTRHLAAFLQRHAGAMADLPGLAGALPEGASFVHPSAVLFNGGVFKSAQLSARVLEVLNGWLAGEGAPPARVIEGADLDLAVARGAAYFGYARERAGVRIRGGTARAYYVGVESPMPAVPGVAPPVHALCLAPFGMEEGTEADVAALELGLVVGEPVRFRFFGSGVRRQDRVGTLLEAWAEDELQELEEIEVSLPTGELRSGDVVPVRLRATATETGTLLLEALQSGGAGRWKLELDVRHRGDD
ncbi:MAG: Hsp70 family protein [Gammaproteobacteria bacterium]|nr:Hsp70 family protein [Gammaproteobacteria bacterium]